jgi:hypothetical protein
LLFHVATLQSNPDTLDALAILVIAIGLLGLAILILFSKRKI